MFSEAVVSSKFGEKSSKMSSTGRGDPQYTLLIVFHLNFYKYIVYIQRFGHQKHHHTQSSHITTSNTQKSNENVGSPVVSGVGRQILFSMYRGWRMLRVTAHSVSFLPLTSFLHTTQIVSFRFPFSSFLFLPIFLFIFLFSVTIQFIFLYSHKISLSIFCSKTIHVPIK